MTHRAPEHLHGVARYAIPSIALVIVLLCVVASCALVGCVSQGEFDAALKQLDAEKANVTEARRLNEAVTGDLIEARNVIRELRQWIAEQAKRLERRLFGGER